MDFTHIEKSGKAVMVDVSSKPIVKRTAVAAGKIFMNPETIDLIKGSLLKKGDAFACARLAGIMAAKKTSELIPLCHNLELENVSVNLSAGENHIDIEASAVCISRTGVEMEALTAVSVAALTLYDMCKAVDKKMVISDIRLLEKKKEQLQ